MDETMDLTTHTYVVLFMISSEEKGHKHIKESQSIVLFVCN